MKMSEYEDETDRNTNIQQLVHAYQSGYKEFRKRIHELYREKQGEMLQILSKKQPSRRASANGKQKIKELQISQNSESDSNSDFSILEEESESDETITKKIHCKYQVCVESAFCD